MRAPPGFASPCTRSLSNMQQRLHIVRGSHTVHGLSATPGHAGGLHPARVCRTSPISSSRCRRISCHARWPWSQDASSSRGAGDEPPPPPPPPPPPAMRSSQEEYIDPEQQELLEMQQQYQLFQQRQEQRRQQQEQAWQQQQALKLQQQQQQQQAGSSNRRFSESNPKWRFFDWPGDSSPAPQQRQQQQRQQWGGAPPPPPHPPPQPQQQRQQAGRGASPPNQQQQQASRAQQEINSMLGNLTDNPKWRWPSWTDEQQQQQQVPPPGNVQWPFIGSAFQPSPPEDIKERLERMGVQFEKEGGQQEAPLPERFEDMDDQQVAQYMDRIRRQRLERVQGRQDDEIVNIVALYLIMTGVIVGLAVLANLPT